MKMMKMYEKNNLVFKTVSKKTSSLSKNDADPILCKHCKRSVSNGLRCMGICVADNEY